MTALQTEKLYLVKKGKCKGVEDPYLSLKQFLKYYMRCRQSLTPLMPDWADAFLRKKTDDFDFKAEFEDVARNWILFRMEKTPNIENLFYEWEWLKNSFASLIELYPTRKAYETV